MTGALALLGGVLAGLASTRLPNAAWLWCAGIGVAGTLLTPLRAMPGARRLALLLGGSWLAWLAVSCWQASLLPPRAPDARVLLEGEITSVPARDGAELGFDAEVRIVVGPGAGNAPRRARLRWRDAEVAPRVGERWRLLARLGHAGATHNFHGLDAQRMAFRDRIHLSARVLPSALNSRLALAHDSIDTLRARIAARIRERIADPDAAGLIAALAVGLTDGMSTDQWRVFNATGTTHLVAISGLHVTLFAMLAFGGARLLWRCMPTGRVLEREPFALLLGLAAAGGYSLLAGFSVPTQRTWLMLAVFAWARLCARPLNAARTWSLALIAVLLLDPFAPLAAGFWLSFVAVGVILLLEGSCAGPVAARGAGTRAATRRHADARAAHLRGVRWRVAGGLRRQSAGDSAHLIRIRAAGAGRRAAGLVVSGAGWPAIRRGGGAVRMALAGAWSGRRISSPRAGASRRPRGGSCSPFQRPWRRCGAGRWPCG